MFWTYVMTKEEYRNSHTNKESSYFIVNERTNSRTELVGKGSESHYWVKEWGNVIARLGPNFFHALQDN